jgi:spermidine synthase
MLTTDSQFIEAQLPYGRKGVEIAIDIDDKLYDTQSEFSHIQVFNTPFFGKMLVIDDIVQTSEYDESIYHEMLITATCTQHGNPKSILIIGGGDGGGAKQALRIKSIEKIVQVEIDPAVVHASELHMPSISEGALRDPKVELIIGDGMQYLKDTKQTFDIIVLDLTDPVEYGPAEALFDTPFYKLVKDSLSPNGIMAIQSGSLLFQPEEVTLLSERLAPVYSNVITRAAVIPGYQLSLFAFLYASDNHQRELTNEELTDRYKNILGNNKYLSKEVYAASTVISPFFLK